MEDKDYKPFVDYFVFGDKKVAADDCLGSADNLEGFLRVCDEEGSGVHTDTPLAPNGQGAANICRYCINLLMGCDEVYVDRKETDRGYSFTINHIASNSKATFDFVAVGDRYEGKVILGKKEKIRVDAKTKIPGQAAKVMLYLQDPVTYKKKKSTTKMSNRMRKRPESDFY